MFGLRSRNPVLSRSSLNSGVFAGTEVMSLESFVNKTGILFMLLVFSFSWVWNHAHSYGFIIGSAIGALILGLVTSFNPAAARITAPLYALCEGVLLGSISKMYEIQSSGLVMQAVLLTFGVFAVMLFLYRSRVIQVTDKMRMIMTSALMAICLVYLVNFIMSFFNASIPFISGSGPFGILFSVLIVGFASFMLILDFDMIEQSIGRVPKQMEWYCAFALMVSIVWLYLEILRLLLKLNNRR